jgi:hypothetical protein
MPRTFYHYDDPAHPDRVTSTTTESAWDPFQLALLDALTDWEADLHVCGRPMSESLRVVGKNEPTYVVGRKICLACKEVDREQKALNDQWKKMHEAGYYPEHYTLLTVHTIAEAQRMIAEQGAISPE